MASLGIQWAPGRGMTLVVCKPKGQPNEVDTRGDGYEKKVGSYYDSVSFFAEEAAQADHVVLHQA